MSLTKTTKACAPCLVARVAAAAGLGLAAGFALRHAAIEPEAVARACEAAVAPFWCPLRLALVQAMRLGLIGLAGVVLGALSFARPVSGPGLATAALALGGLGLALHNPLTGAAALLIGMLALVRAWRSLTPSQTKSPGQGQQ